MAALLLGVAACSQASTAKGVETPLTFEARPDLGETAASLPRLVGQGAAIAAIKADLDRLDATARANPCEDGGGHKRSVSQPMTGPGFVSFRIVEGAYCPGTAHPGYDETAVT